MSVFPAHDDRVIRRRPSLRARRADVSERSEATTAYYEKNARPYCVSTRPLSMAPQLERFVGGLPRGATVLDAGCGSGRDLAALKAAGFQALGLDVSPRLAAMAERHSQCPVVVGDMRCPPFAKNSFDGIWAAASLLHLRRDDVVPTLRSLSTFLVPGGRLFASVKAGTGEERSPDGRWFTYFQPGEWRQLLIASGFADIEVACESDGDGRDWIQSFASRP